MVEMSVLSHHAGGVIHVSTLHLVLSMAPLLFVIAASWKMELGLGSAIVTGAFRTLVQLSILGAILQPIFAASNVYVVLGYSFLMTICAAHASCARTKYVFKGQFFGVLGSLLIMVSLVGTFAFGVIIRPIPLYNPQYVIPIVGMLLGNCVNGISLTMNQLTVSIVEQQREIELSLSFGASYSEAISRLLREAVRDGTTPLLNSMTVIGIVAIPGMMTGQILGGSPVMEAAHYQALIMYLIALATFGVVFMEVVLILNIGFDETHMLRSDRFVKPPKKPSFWGMVQIIFRYMTGKRSGADAEIQKYSNASEVKPLRDPNIDAAQYTSLKDPEGGFLEVHSLAENDVSKPKSCLVVDDLARVFPTENGSKMMQARVLFQGLSFKVGSSGITLIRGPSGSGKSQLLRCIAALSPVERGQVQLDGISWNDTICKSGWRKKVRYVTQYKIDIPGTPYNFIKKVASFKSWVADPLAPSEFEMTKTILALIIKWGLTPECLSQEWSMLSGGEAQRVILAIAFASKPRVILFDESTSALDMTTKLAVEDSIKEFSKKHGWKVLIVSHDVEQARRLL